MNSSLQSGIDCWRDWNVTEILALSCFDLAYIHQALGNDEKSHESLRDAIQIKDSFSPSGIKNATAHQVKFDLAGGDMDAVERWTQTNDLVINMIIATVQGFIALLVARILGYEPQGGVIGLLLVCVWMTMVFPQPLKSE